MSAFTTNPTVFSNAKSAKESGNLPQFITGLVSMGFFADATSATEAFEAAIVAERAAKLAETRAKAHGAGVKALDGFTWPSSVSDLLANLGDIVAVPDAEGNSNPWSVVLTLNPVLDPETGEDTGKMELDATLAGSVSAPKRTRGPSQNSSGGKALLDGKRLTAALLRTPEYASTIAGRIAINKMAPFGIANKANGDPYGENTKFNATQAVKADPVLRERLTFAE
jgi:hypothetical protein